MFPPCACWKSAGSGNFPVQILQHPREGQERQGRASVAVRARLFNQVGTGRPGRAGNEKPVESHTRRNRIAPGNDRTMSGSRFHPEKAWPHQLVDLAPAGRFLLWRVLMDRIEKHICIGMNRSTPSR